MGSISRIRPGRLHLDAGQVILRAHDYQRFVQSRAIVDSAHDHAQSIREQAVKAHDEARRAGYEKGLVEGEHKIIARHIAFVRSALDFTAQLESDIHILVKDVIAKIIGQMDIDDVTLKIVAKAIAHYGSLPEVKLRVAASQEKKVRAAVEKMSRHRAGGMKFIRVQADSQLQPGDCILDSPIGSVDAGLDTQLAAIMAALQSASDKSLRLTHHDDDNEGADNDERN